MAGKAAGSSEELCPSLQHGEQGLVLRFCGMCNPLVGLAEAMRYGGTPIPPRLFRGEPCPRDACPSTRWHRALPGASLPSGFCFLLIASVSPSGPRGARLAMEVGL